MFSQPDLAFVKRETFRYGVSVMNEVMTIADIEANFDSEWVLLGDPVTDEELHVLSGHVLAHSRDRDEVDRCLLALRPRRYATWYTGRLPDDMAVVL